MEEQISGCLGLKGGGRTREVGVAIEGNTRSPEVMDLDCLSMSTSWPWILCYSFTRCYRWSKLGKTKS